LGGGVSFGVGYSIGVIKTYVKPPQVNWPASLIAQLHGAMYNSRAGWPVTGFPTVFFDSIAADGGAMANRIKHIAL